VPPMLTIDELAQRVGMSVRNLREWRTLGLVPPAEVRGRVGYYDEAVVERIETIQRLHEYGFTLELIRRMLETSGESGEEVMRLAQTLLEPFHARAADAAELDQRARATLRELGVPQQAALDATAEIRAHADAIAAIFERLWRDHVWQPFLDAGAPASELPALRDAVAAVQPLATDTVATLFTVAMETRIEQGIAREVQRDG
jgi:DNA-binding transcriptional MerR regulator